MAKYMKRFERIGKDFEIQFYDNEGREKVVIALKTAEELAEYLSAEFWGCIKFLPDFNNPTIYYNGKRFGDWSEIKEVDDLYEHEKEWISDEKHEERDSEVYPVLLQLEALFKAIKHPTTQVMVKHVWKDIDEYVYVYINDACYPVCITADSKTAIVKDVVDKVIYKF